MRLFIFMLVLMAGSSAYADDFGARFAGESPSALEEPSFIPSLIEPAAGDEEEGAILQEIQDPAVVADPSEVLDESETQTPSTP
ncbi:MAG: hypothetical protein K9G62_03050 [Alphaproteobacteria bacterium]|nr:hypothetical protein [Alphaproteobacteria bacterium]